MREVTPWVVAIAVRMLTDDLNNGFPRMTGDVIIFKKWGIILFFEDNSLSLPTEILLNSKNRNAYGLR